MASHGKFQRGIAYFNSGEFFQAHEVWEELWLTEIERQRLFLQGLIQAAAAFHHYRRGNSTGAQSLLASAAVKLRRFPPEHCAIDVGKLRNELIFWARSLGEGQDPGPDKLPQIAPVSRGR
jgi:predicted metal-dependent hydrolase